MNRKAFFFDIDGTLWDDRSVIPDSARSAVREIRASGHAVLICSGRSKGYIFKDDLLSLGFDGIVSSAGAMVEVGGRTLRCLLADQDLLKRTVDSAFAAGYASLLEGNTALYMDREVAPAWPYVDKLYRELGPRLRPLNATRGQWTDVPKLSLLARGKPDPDAAIRALEQDWDIIVHAPEVLELTPRGIDKGSGLLLALEALGIPAEDSVAFGDGQNDLGMFRAAGLRIAMGNGSDALKAEADYVTTDLWDDGLWNAWQWLKERL